MPGRLTRHNNSVWTEARAICRLPSLPLISLALGLCGLTLRSEFHTVRFRVCVCVCVCVCVSVSVSVCLCLCVCVSDRCVLRLSHTFTSMMVNRVSNFTDDWAV